MLHIHAFSCIDTFKFLYFLYCILLVLFWLSLSLSLPLFVFYVSCVMAPKRKFTLSRNPLLLLTPLHLMSGSVMRRPNQTFWRTFHNEAFTRNAKSFCQTFLTLTYPLSSTVGVGSHCVAPWSCALPWSYMSFTPICMNLITLYPSLSLAFGVYAWWLLRVLYLRYYTSLG